jgi:4-amino-4-deoxy-L-arabinose transferase-like glycosyltransferase
MTALALASRGSDVSVFARRHARLVVLVAAYILLVLIAFDGIGPGDGLSYVRAALDLYEGADLAGPDHWSLRWPLVAPMAMIFAISGPSEIGAVLPNIAYGLGLLLLTFFALERLFSQQTALIASLVVLTTINITVRPLEVAIDGVELFFVAASLWALILGLATTGSPDRRLLFLCGLAAGGAWLCRESTVFLIPTIAAMALLHRKHFKSIGVLAGAGFLVVLLLEFVFYSAIAGDPFYRLETDLGHGGGQKGTAIGAQRFEETSATSFVAEPFEQLFLNPLVGPLAVLGAAAGGLTLFTRPSLTAGGSRVVLVFSLAAALSFLIAAFGLSLEHPLYYPVVPYTAALLVGLAAAHFMKGPRPAVGYIVLGSYAVIQLLVAVSRLEVKYEGHRWLAGELQALGQPADVQEDDVFPLRIYLRLGGMKASRAEDLIRSEDGTIGSTKALVSPGDCRDVLPDPDEFRIFRTGNALSDLVQDRRPEPGYTKTVCIRYADVPRN